MKKVLLMAVVILITASGPAFSVYEYNWTENFEPTEYAPGAIEGQDGWVLPVASSEVTMDVTAGQGKDASQGVVQRIGASSAARSMTYLNTDGVTYYTGSAVFWALSMARRAPSERWGRD